MTKILKLLFFQYQQWMYYVGLADGEYGKIGRFLSPTILLLTYLRVNGISVKFWQIPIFYIIIMLIAVAVGIFLDKLGIPHYNATLGNKRNPELMEIIARLERIEKGGK